MDQLVFAVAQSIATKGNLEQNIKQHLRLIKYATNYKADLIIFPELSLTGYEPTLAEALAFLPDDERLTPLVESARLHKMILVAGAPVRDQAGLFIGSFIIYPDGCINLYTKHFLHSGEEKTFIAGKKNWIANVDSERISFAICADMTNKSHPAVAFSNHSSLYMVSGLITPHGYEKDAALLQSYANEYKMTVFLSNFGGPTGGFDSAGKSAVWSDKGLLMGELPDNGEGLLIATKTKDEWSVLSTPIDSVTWFCQV